MTDGTDITPADVIPLFATEFCHPVVISMDRPDAWTTCYAADTP